MRNNFFLENDITFRRSRFSHCFILSTSLDWSVTRCFHAKIILSNCQYYPVPIIFWFLFCFCFFPKANSNRHRKKWRRPVRIQVKRKWDFLSIDVNFLATRGISFEANNMQYLLLGHFWQHTSHFQTIRTSRKIHEQTNLTAFSAWRLPRTGWL